MQCKRSLSLFFWLFCFLAVPGALQAQELNCQVQVNDAQVDVADKRIFREMERSIATFLNNTRWSEQEYQPHERINCNIQITLVGMPAVGSYTGTLVVRAVRPVYNSSYTTATLNFIDREFNFNYVEAQPINFSLNNFNDNLSSMLAFYAYMIVGTDNDTFEKLGGNDAFQQARTIAQVADQQGGGGGWNATQGGNASRNRGALVEGMFNSRLQQIREVMYEYHRLGLDTFTADAEASRKLILDNLAKLKQVRDYNPSAIPLIAFFDSKAQELANIFQQGAPQVKQQAYTLLVALDPSNTDKYQTILR